MDKRLQELLDHYEIRKLVSEYCHGVDRLDQVRMASIYAKDSWDEHGPNKGPGREFAERVMNAMKSGASLGDSHMLGQTLINVDGDEAGADTYFIATIRKLDADGKEILNQMGGRYVDALVREDGRWKVKKRICVHDWSNSSPVTADWLGKAAYVQGKRSNEDPSYAVLGVEHSGVPGSG
jgi:SnoaL-like protein